MASSVAHRSRGVGGGATVGKLVFFVLQNPLSWQHGLRVRAVVQLRNPRPGVVQAAGEAADQLPRVALASFAPEGSNCVQVLTVRIAPAEPHGHTLCVLMRKCADARLSIRRVAEARSPSP